MDESEAMMVRWVWILRLRRPEGYESLLDSGIVCFNPMRARQQLHPEPFVCIPTFIRFVSYSNSGIPLSYTLHNHSFLLVLPHTIPVCLWAACPYQTCEPDLCLSNPLIPSIFDKVYAWELSFCPSNFSLKWTNVYKLHLCRCSTHTRLIRNMLSYFSLSCLSYIH